MDINRYLPELRDKYMQDVLSKVCEVIQSKGVIMSSSEEVNHVFKERIKGTVFNGITTITLDDSPICEYGTMEVSQDGNEFTITFKFREL